MKVYKAGSTYRLCGLQERLKQINRVRYAANTIEAAKGERGDVAEDGNGVWEYVYHQLIELSDDTLEIAESMRSWRESNLEGDPVPYEVVSVTVSREEWENQQAAIVRLESRVLDAAQKILAHDLTLSSELREEYERIKALVEGKSLDTIPF